MTPSDQAAVGPGSSFASSAASSAVPYAVPCAAWGAVSRNPGCPLCGRRAASEHLLLWEDEDLHIVRIDEPGHPCFFRVICNQHIAEMTDLDPVRQQQLWTVLGCLETLVRRSFGPAKINLASMGNMVPHLHWHLIGRWPDDPHFPGSVWSTAQRDPDSPAIRNRRLLADGALPAFRRELSDEIGRLEPVLRAAGR